MPTNAPYPNGPYQMEMPAMSASMPDSMPMGQLGAGRRRRRTGKKRRNTNKNKNKNKTNRKNNTNRRKMRRRTGGNKHMKTNGSTY